MLGEPEATSFHSSDDARLSARAAAPHPEHGARARVVRLLATLMALFAVTGCGRLPTDAGGERAHARGVTRYSTDATDAAGGRNAIAVLTQCNEGDSVAIANNSQVLDAIPELSLVLLKTPPGQTTDTFVDQLRGDGRVVHSEPDEMVQTAETRQSTVAFSEATRTWSDVYDQTALARVGAAAAQAYTQGGGALVAIVDTGIDLDHPALADALALPGIELGGGTDPGDDRPEGVDTNHDGIVDGALGHGTHVAGIVHALAPGARLLPVRVLDSDGVGGAFRVAKGIVAAVERGAVVINLSLGLPASSPSIQAALDMAHAAGVVVVAAAGNDDLSALDFPASYPSVLAVAGTDPDDRKADFSDFGSGVALAAPAVGILSTYWDGTYARWSGTSMASPFVAGTAALLYGSLGPAAPASEALVEQLILAGADPLGSIDPVFGGLLGAGRLNAANAVARSEQASNPGDSEGTREIGH